MTPHSLRLTAFGAFADTVTVDFDALAGAGLFLLHGPTGGGKSTLLDGIGFALFGRVPGPRNAAKRLRSDYAAGVLTEVCLEATFGSRRIRITRSPAYDRPKARGAGTTPQQARVLLEELIRGQWVTLSSRPREADDEVLDLVGMNAEQFFQVVLLPQGEFAQFLRASSVDRAALLQKLFSTERFADVETWLAQRRRACSEQVATAAGVVDEIIARIREVAGVADVLDAPALLIGVASAAAQCQEVVAAATSARDAHRRVLEQVVALDGRQKRRQLALSRAAALEASLPERLALQAEATSAGHAATVAPFRTEAARRRAARDAALVACDAEERPSRELRVLASAARQRAGALETLQAVDDVRRNALDVVDHARAEQADAFAAAAGAELELASLPVRRDEVAAHLAAADKAALSLPTLIAERDQLAALRPDLLSLIQVTDVVVLRREQCLSAGETSLALKSKALEVRKAIVDSMVARLAFGLEDGVPCEVCGSPVHPDPSSMRDEGVTAEDERASQLAADEAEAIAARLNESLATASARLLDLTERAGAWTLPLLDERLAGLDLELGVLRVQASDIPRLKLDLAGLEKRRTGLEKLHVAAASRADAADRRGREAAERAEQALIELTTAGAEDLLPALERATAEAAALEAAAAAAEALKASQLELDASLDAVESACAAAGFGSETDAVEAFRDAAWRTQTATQLRKAADLEAAVKAELADPALDVELEPAAPVAATTALVQEADAALAAAHAELGALIRQRESLERLVPALAAARAEVAPLEAVAAEVRRLADLCAGQGANALKMTLASFVLAARLEEVAAAATVRLLRMTQGRYELVHTDGGARGGVRSGLGLLVRDSWSGLDRDTATLSGGETFLASLALALGLADVVTAEAGGARIGALFIDEGFGMLDEETLDEVMDVLDGLREGGRLVGLVSHVTELRQRIPVRLEVLKGRAGSQVVTHGC